MVSGVVYRIISIAHMLKFRPDQTLEESIKQFHLYEHLIAIMVEKLQIMMLGTPQMIE